MFQVLPTFSGLRVNEPNEIEAIFRMLEELMSDELADLTRPHD
jgi:hypothetical protein